MKWKNSKYAFFLVVVILIAGQIYFSKSEKSIEQKTRERAEKIGRKLFEKNFQRTIYTADSGKRSLASESNATLATIEEGEIGRDPWGYPFHYKKTDNKLAIWSSGANHQNETIAGGQSQGDDVLVELTR